MVAILCGVLVACGGRTGDVPQDTAADRAAMRRDTASPQSATSGRDTTATRDATTPGAAQPRDTPRRERVAPPRLSGETVRGTVTVEGADPMTRVMLRSQGGAKEVAGPHARTLSRLNGVTVLARGTTSGSVLTVEEFVVTAVNGEPVLDGRIVEDGEAVAMMTMEGRRVALRDVPAALRALAGHRVWLRASASGEPESWHRID